MTIASEIFGQITFIAYRKILRKYPLFRKSIHASRMHSATQIISDRFVPAGTLRHRDIHCVSRSL
jgi:hypothetical protein